MTGHLSLSYCLFIMNMIPSTKLKPKAHVFVLLLLIIFLEQLLFSILNKSLNSGVTICYTKCNIFYTKASLYYNFCTEVLFFNDYTV